MAENVKTVQLTFDQLVFLTQKYEDSSPKTSQEESTKGMLHYALQALLPHRQEPCQT